MSVCKLNQSSQPPAPSSGDDLAQSFDYTSLDAETLAMMQRCTSMVKSLIKPRAKDVIAAGETLLAVKHRLGRGRFGPWLEAAFGKSSRTAQKFMRVAIVLKNEDFSNFFKNEESSFLDIDTSALCHLTEDSTPKEARQEAIDRAYHGERITNAKAKAIVNQYKPSPAKPKPNSKVQSASPESLPQPLLAKVRSAPSISKAVIDVRAETISAQDTTVWPSQQKERLPCDRTCHYQIDGHPAPSRLSRLTKLNRDLTLIDPANSRLPKEPLSAQLSISDIDWHNSQLLNNSQTLKIPLCLWVEGPSYVLSTLHKQITENADIKALIFDKFSVLMKEVAELVA